MNKIISLPEHQRVLATCVDVPGEKPSLALPLSEVGIGAKTVWVLLPQGRIPLTAELSVDLAADRRGIHMSRMEEVISALYAKEFTDIKEYGVELGSHLVSRQDAGRGRVKLSGKLPLLTPTSVRGRASVDSFDVFLEAGFVNKGGRIATESLLLGVGVTHITACPCTQVYNQVLFNREAGPCPLPTHSQRSHTTLTVEASADFPTVEDLHKVLDSALHVTQDLLKRPDEAEVIMQSHQRPQFAEDAVRETARQVAMLLGTRLSGQARVKIASTSFESIHIHDVICRIETTMAELLGLTGQELKR